MNITLRNRETVSQCCELPASMAAGIMPRQPTFTRQIVGQIVALSRTELNGLFHATAEGSCSWVEFTLEIFERTGTNLLEAASPGEFPAKVRVRNLLKLAPRRSEGLARNSFHGIFRPSPP